MSKALMLQRGTPMNRFTAVFLATVSLAALSGCGLDPDETIDENGNVQKVSHQDQALEGADPVVNPADPDVGTGADVPVVQVVVVAPGANGVPTVIVAPTPVVNPRDPGLAGLPQDPIPLIDPAKPQPPNGGGDPRVGPQNY